MFVDITIRNCFFLITSDKSIAYLKKQAYTVISVGPKKLDNKINDSILQK